MSTRERCEHILEMIDDRLEQYDAWVGALDGEPPGTPTATLSAWPYSVFAPRDGYRVAS
jgi:hypothetical protein